MTAAPAVGEGRRFASFLITGGIAAAVNLVARWILSLFIRYEFAVALAHFIGMIAAFTLARRFVFEGSGSRWESEVLRFAMVNVMSFMIVLSVSVGLVRWGFPAMGMTWHAEDVAHLIGVISPTAVSYYAHKHFSFGGK